LFGERCTALGGPVQIRHNEAGVKTFSTQLVGGAFSPGSISRSEKNRETCQSQLAGYLESDALIRSLDWHQMRFIDISKVSRL
jgi:hypothetical protein